MTCIVGLVHEGSVYIGGDSAGVGGWTIHGRSDEKVFRNGAFLFGFTSSFRMGQLLHYSLVPPEQPEGTDLFRYLVVDFINAVRACLKDGGFAKKNSEAEEGGHFLVGYRGRLFHINADYQVAEMSEGYMAIGAGEDIALGALHASASFPPLKRVRMALEAAAHHNIGVRGPFVIAVLEADPAANGRHSRKRSKKEVPGELAPIAGSQNHRSELD